MPFGFQSFWIWIFLNSKTGSADSVDTPTHQNKLVGKSHETRQIDGCSGSHAHHQNKLVGKSHETRQIDELTTVASNLFFYVYSKQYKARTTTVAMIKNTESLARYITLCIFTSKDLQYSQS